MQDRLRRLEMRSCREDVINQSNFGRLRKLDAGVDFVELG